MTVQVQDAYGNVITTDNTDAVTLSVASGPGSFLAGGTTTATVHNGVATFNNLTLVVPGNYKLAAIVPNLYVGPNSSTFTVIPLQVVAGSFASAAWGFSLSFNAPILVNSTTPILYGTGFGPSAPVPSVTLTQTKDGSGNTLTLPVVVEGSLVLNTATNSLTFLETDTANLFGEGLPPQLVDGTYVVDLTSSAAHDGFQSINPGGGFLDGLGTGNPGSGDYTSTFTVNATAAGDDVVWVPATADGPGQVLSAPGKNQAGGGYPVYLSSSAANVTSALVTLNYNPALLTVSGVTGAHFSLLGTSTPGHANLQYSGPALAAGLETPLGFITATVPAGTTANPTAYKAKDVLHLSNVSINGGAVTTVTTADGLHLVAYVADADGNGSYGSNDAVLITRVDLQTDSGFTAYPLVDPVIVADTDGAGFIPADAALQANEAGVGFPTANLTIPPVPPNVHFQAIANNVDPTLTLQGSGVSGQGSGGIVAVSVNIDDAHPPGSTGLTEGHLALTYDPSAFTVSAADIHLGSVLAAGSGWSVVPTINPITGEIAIALASNTPISASIGGSLVTIDFHPMGGVRGEGSGVRSDGSALTPDPSPLTPVLLVASVNPTGQQTITTELEDAQGSFTLTPAPNGGFDSRIDGVVMSSPNTAPIGASAPAVVASVELQGEGYRADVPAPPIPADNENLGGVSTELNDQGLIAGPSGLAETAMPRVSPSGLVVQIANVLIAATTPGGIGVSQHVSDPLFQALVHGPITPPDPSLFGAIRDAGERILVRLLRSPSPADMLDNLNWEEASSDLDWQMSGEAKALWGRRMRREEAVLGALPRAAEPTTANRDLLDQYFAQAANGTDQTAEDE